MRVAVGMSGGVDSTVAVSLLLEQGHEVVGLTMQVWDGAVDLPAGGRASCYGPDEAGELESVRALAARLGIEHHAVALADAYREEVLDYFRREYLAGRTPNPCVRCNHRLKVGFLLSRAMALGIRFDAFATGHYARVLAPEAPGGRYRLCRAVDWVKDQSYFLAHLRQEQLARVRFPLGALHKEEVRERARALGLGELAEQPESQDFIGCDDYSPLFAGSPADPGPMLDRAGREVGRHRGLYHYTIGQRKGLGLSGSAEPLYVTGIDAARNAVIVGPREDLLAGGLVAGDINWIGMDGLHGSCRAAVRIRRQAPDAPATLSRAADGSGVEVRFDTPLSAVTPGQAVVFYEGDVVLGGGWIERALPV